MMVVSLLSCNNNFFDWIKKVMNDAQQNNCWYYAGEMPNFHKVVLEPAPEGTYIFIYQTAVSKFAEKDYLQDDLEDAKKFCEQELGLHTTNWQEDGSMIKLMN